ncbi:MAG: hypothetical protein AB8G05_11015 [Oligoflexales bacterium]
MKKNFLLGETKLEDVLSKKIWDYVIESRANIRFESDVVAEIECSFETGNAGSLNSENINCPLFFPSLSNQLIFGRTEAIAIANLLQGNEPYQYSNGSVNGQINCQWKASEAQCVVSRISDRESGQSFNLLEKYESFFVYSRLLYLQRYHLPKNQSFDPKTILFSPINCKVDISSLRENGSYTANCKVTFME